MILIKNVKLIANTVANIIHSISGIMPTTVPDEFNPDGYCRLYLNQNMLLSIELTAKEIIIYRKEIGLEILFQAVKQLETETGTSQIIVVK